LEENPNPSYINIRKCERLLQVLENVSRKAAGAQSRTQKNDPYTFAMFTLAPM
jgi:hypothetical protein